MQYTRCIIAVNIDEKINFRYVFLTVAFRGWRKFMNFNGTKFTVRWFCAKLKRFSAVLLSSPIAVFRRCNIPSCVY